jgi:galactofuranosylgalactofuranosylrhamnosyl-N-acetylglucosaminyl-diphospho-decaprenol beta-1,5/1,6-galactofuranosyltransferase
MNVISRIRFPLTLEAASLYIKCHEGASLHLEDAKITLTKNGIFSLNSYFNSFYEKFYDKYTELESLYYLLKLEGDFQVCLYRECYGQENRQLIYQENFYNCRLEESKKIILPDSWHSHDAGRVYLEITCMSEWGLFTEGYLVTDQYPLREVSLGIVSCTFKKEAYVKKTIDNILKDKFLQSKKLKIFVVDNAKTLNGEDFKNQNFELIPNRNLGGSGGFTRGLIQALEEDTYTHFLFMDDDIELETECIYRLFPLYEYAKQDFAVAGSMLDFCKKHMLYEAGALFGKILKPNGDCSTEHPFRIASLRNKVNLENSNSINLLLSEQHPDYGAFWFFSFSKQVVDEMGLPMPFFIKLDDIEFGLRIKELIGKPIVAFPGVAVWHEPGYAKNPIWDAYYSTRNSLITHSIRNSLKYTDAIKFLTRNLINKLFVFDYNSAEMIVKGFEDYMQGPLLMESNDAETLHAAIIGLSKTHKTQSIQSLPTLNKQLQKNLETQKPEQYAFTKLFAFATFNGHLLPNFLLSNDDALFIISPDHVDLWTKVFTKKRILFFRESNTSVYQHEMSRAAGMGILLKWLLLIIKGTLKWSSVSRQWRHAFGHLTSMEFWKKYLKLNDRELSQSL